MEVPHTIVQNRRESIWLADETSLTGDELWGDQTARPTTICMSHLLSAIRCKHRRPADRHHPMVSLKSLLVRLCSVVGVALQVTGLGCNYPKPFQVETDGRIQGGPQSVMSVFLEERIEGHWNARRNTSAFPYLTSSFADLTIWELILFMLDRSIVDDADFADIEPAMVQFGYQLYSLMTEHLDSNLMSVCSLVPKSETLRKMTVRTTTLQSHRNRRAERKAVIATQLHVALTLWDRARYKNPTVLQSLQMKHILLPTLSIVTLVTFGVWLEIRNPVSSRLWKSCSFPISWGQPSQND